MKKIVALTLALAFVLSTTGCGNNKEDEALEKSTSATAITESVTEKITTEKTTKITSTEAILTTDIAEYKLDSTKQFGNLSYASCSEWTYETDGNYQYCYQPDFGYFMIYKESFGTYGYIENSKEFFSGAYSTMRDEGEFKNLTEPKDVAIDGYPAILYEFDYQQRHMLSLSILTDNESYSISFNTKIGKKDTVLSECANDIINSIQFPDIEFTSEPSTEPPTEAPTEPLTEPPTPQYSFEPFYAKGTGDAVMNITIPSKLVVCKMQNNSDYGFTASYYDCAGERETLVNEIGSYSGVQLFNGIDFDSSSAGMLETKSSGSWEFTFYPLNQYLSGEEHKSFSGTGDSVVGVFRGTGNMVLNMKHYGQYSFVVRAYEFDENSGHYLSAAIEIGPYSGQTVLRTEPGKLYCFNVIADGNWELSFQ